MHISHYFDVFLSDVRFRSLTAASGRVPLPVYLRQCDSFRQFWTVVKDPSFRCLGPRRFVTP